MSTTTQPPRVATLTDYTRTCDGCRKYVEKAERINSVEVTQFDESPGLGWYGFQDTIVNHLCDKCYFAARLEGAL